MCGRIKRKIANVLESEVGHFGGGYGASFDDQSLDGHIANCFIKVVSRENRSAARGGESVQPADDDIPDGPSVGGERGSFFDGRHEPLVFVVGGGRVLVRAGNADPLRVVATVGKRAVVTVNRKAYVKVQQLICILHPDVFNDDGAVGVMDADGDAVVRSPPEVTVDGDILSVFVVSSVAMGSPAGDADIGHPHAIRSARMDRPAERIDKGEIG